MGMNIFDSPKSEENPREPQERHSETKHRLLLILRSIFCFLLAAISAASILMLFAQVNQDRTASDEEHRVQKQFALFDMFSGFVRDSQNDTIENLEYIRKTYTIDRDATVAPMPNSEAYGELSVSDAAEVLKVIEKARESGLLDGQDVIFDENADFYWDSTIQYYCDDTILVICWKELIERRVCSCVEVKIADGSQIRRKLVEDTYGSKKSDFATNLAKSCNAVVAMNADFYSTRNYGITVYQGEMYRYQTSCDVMMVDSGGDFHMFKRNELLSREETEQYIRDNDIQFGLTFGPVLVQNGELQLLEDNYGGIGEMHLEYSRAGIAQYDKLHYLYMTISHSKDKTSRAKINEFAKIIYSKGVQSAYNFDGGQTGEVVFRGVPYNHIDFGFERTVSDIIYFATAMPEDEAS